MQEIIAKQINFNLNPKELTTSILTRKEGVLTKNGTLLCYTGQFTGRSPKDRYIVNDDITRDSVDWSKINIPIGEYHYWMLYRKMLNNLKEKELFVRDAIAGADPRYQLPVKIYNTKAWHNLFCYNMFLRPTGSENFQLKPFTIICDPDFKADPESDGTMNENFSIINFSERVILIGGTGYTGEMKKGIFSVLNFLLPHKYDLLSMHCSVNVGQKDDPAIFFGLSGTGKTTLSADPNRYLVGDDEHVWTNDGVFNIEGGCYAKTIGLSKEKEPEIYEAIRPGAIVENMNFIPGTQELNFEDDSITPNIRVSYPIHFIDNALTPSITSGPKNIFFLTCDAYGVLPPIAKLNNAQAMFHFLSGYTAKVSGTEMGITEPKTVFSACFGAPFLPLHPTAYADKLGEKINDNGVNIWLVNTGWTGGSYGIGERISLKYTRALISAALDGELDYISYTTDRVFGLSIPTSCPGIPNKILDPYNTWNDKEAYFKTAENLADAFIENFKTYKEKASDEIKAGAPSALLSSI